MCTLICSIFIFNYFTNIKNQVEILLIDEAKSDVCLGFILSLKRCLSCRLRSLLRKRHLHQFLKRLMICYLEGNVCDGGRAWMVLGFWRGFHFEPPSLPHFRTFNYRAIIVGDHACFGGHPVTKYSNATSCKIFFNGNI